MDNTPICEPPQWRRIDIFCLLAIIAAALACNASIAFLGRVPLDSDSLLFFYPLVSMHGDSTVGLWSPYQFCGFPRESNPQAQLLYWPAWAAMVLPTQVAFPLLIVFHFALGGVGMYVLLRGLRVAPLAALFGATVFLMSTYWRCKITNLGILEGAAWAPFFLYFNLIALQKRSWIPLLCASLFLSMVILAGVPHTVVYLLLLSIILHLGTSLWDIKSIVHSMAMYLGLVVAGLLLSAGMLLPALFNLSETVRTELALKDALQGALPLVDVWKAFLGGLSQPGISRTDPWEGTCYIGATALLLVPLGWKAMPTRLRWPFFAAIVLSLALTVGKQGFIYPILYDWLPGWNSLNLPSRSLLMAAIALPVFSAFGAERIFTLSASKKRAVSLFIAGFFLIGIWIIAALLNPTLFITLTHSALTQQFQPGAYSDGAWALLTFSLWSGLTVLAIACLSHSWIKPKVLWAILLALAAAQSAQYTQRLFLETAPSTYLQEPRTVRAVKDWQSSQPFARTVGFDPTLDSGNDVRMKYIRSTVSPRLNEVFRLHDAQGYDPLVPKHYAELSRAWAGHSAIVHPDRNIRFQSLPPKMVDVFGVGSIIGRPNHLVLYQGQVGLEEPGRVETPLQPPQALDSLLLRWVAIGAGRLQQGAKIGSVHLISASQPVQSLPIRLGVHVADQIVQFGPGAAAHRSAAEYRWFPIPSRFGYVQARQYEAVYPAQTNQPVDAVSIELTTSNITLLIYGVFAEPIKKRFQLITDAAEIPVWKHGSKSGFAYLSRTPIEYDSVEDMVEQFNNWPHDEPPIFFDQEYGPGPERAPNAKRLEGNSSLRVHREHSDHFTITVQSDFDAMLAVSEGYSPNWTAAQDGEPLAIFRANHAFMAVQVSAGTHEIKFHYFPKLYYYGCSIGVTAWVLILAMLCLYPRQWLLRETHQPKGTLNETETA